jgi:hypothetical protein
MLGKMTIHAKTLEILMDQLLASCNEEVVCNLAGWINTDARGKFLSVEISPDFAKGVTAANQMSLRERFGERAAPQSSVTRPPNKYCKTKNGSTLTNDRSTNGSDDREISQT